MDTKLLAAKWRAIGFFGEDVEQMEHLIMSGADINMRQEPDLWTALHFVVWRCRFDLSGISAVELLLRHKADPHLQTHLHKTPLDVGMIALHPIPRLLDADIVSLLKFAMA